MERPVLRSMGPHAVLVELPDAPATLALYERLRGTTPTWLAELVPAARTVLAVADPARGGTPAALRSWIAQALSAPEQIDGSGLPGPSRLGGQALATSVLHLPVHYDGDDLDELGRLTGLGVDGVIEAHTALEWTAAFIGFAPGFAYLTVTGSTFGPDTAHAHPADRYAASSHPFAAIPRRASPRTRVPAGSVALAAGYCGVYPAESPGGWQLLGRTDAVLWDASRSEPALLAPGTRVRFHRA